MVSNGWVIIFVIFIVLSVLGMLAAIWAIKQIGPYFETKTVSTKLIVAVLVLAFLAFIVRWNVGFLWLPMMLVVFTLPIWVYLAIERIRRRFAPQLNIKWLVVAVIVLAILAGNIDKLSRL